MESRAKSGFYPRDKRVQRLTQRRRSHQPNRRSNSRDENGGRRATLSRALSKLGYCSRTQADVLISEGRVSVDGRTTSDPAAWIDLDLARIAVDGLPVVEEQKHYLMLNKPRGLVTTRHDPEGRPTVYDCLKGFDGAHISPVGRLDKASEGLLLFTNDTVLAQALLDPITHVTKTYHVQVDRIMQPEELSRMTSGIIDDGELLTATSARLLRSGDRNAWIEVELSEGRNRQIRRMLEALGIECLRLVRVAIADLLLGALAKGAVRPLSDSEISRLRERAGMKSRSVARRGQRP
jgi:23S rRNA pseudouridine2605 synthase